MKEGKRKSLFFIFLLLALLYRLFISWNNFVCVDDIFILDDSYYCFTIARNISLGNGITSDGINQTNGFQPLYVLLMVPLYLLFPDDKIMPLHSALTILSLCNIAIGLLIFKLVRIFANYKAALFSLVLWSFSPYCLVNGINGMESSLAGLFFTLSIYLYVTRIRCAESYSRKQFIYLGCIVGLAILSRIDQIIFLFTLCCDRFWCYWKQHGTFNLKGFFQESLLMVCFSAIIFSPWMSWNYVNFGTLIPRTSEVVHTVSLAYLNTLNFNHLLFPVVGLIATVGSIGDMLLPVFRILFYYFRPQLTIPFLGALILSSLFYISLYFTIKPFFNAQSLFSRRIYSQLQPFSFLVLFVVAFFLAYIFRVGGWWYFPRYYFPVFISIVLFLGLVFPLFSDHTFSGKIKLSHSIAKGVSIGIYAATTVFFLLLIIFYRPENTDRGYYKVGEWINDHLDEETVVGAFQSGAISYFADNRTVINLDGVVNYQAFHSLRSHKFLSYLRSRKISYIIAWEKTLLSFIEIASPEVIKVGEDVTLAEIIPSPGSIVAQWNVYEVTYP